jgi:hypothetical protein
MRTFKFFLVIAVLFIVIPFACKDDNQVTNPTNQQEDPGILRTDEFGNILGGDSTDWCWKDAPSGFRFGPAYPNPAVGNTFKVKVTLPSQDFVTLFFIKNQDTITVENIMLPAGVTLFEINASGYYFTNSYRRLYLKCSAYAPSDSCKNYGDIKFEE